MSPKEVISLIADANQTSVSQLAINAGIRPDSLYRMLADRDGANMKLSTLLQLLGNNCCELTISSLDDTLDGCTLDLYV